MTDLSLPAIRALSRLRLAEHVLMNLADSPHMNDDVMDALNGLAEVVRDTARDVEGLIQPKACEA